jgi:hypothetical protein
MGALLYLFFPWGIILQAVAIFHFIRRRPDTYWLFIILFGGGLGAIVYLLVEAIPDLGLLRTSFKAFPRRKRIRELEAAILDNPSPGNYEELADLYMEEGKYRRARELFDRAISARTDSIDAFYRRAVCSVEMEDFPKAIPDLERVVRQDAKYDYHRAAGLLAHAYARTGETERAEALFRQVLELSTLSETQYNFATLPLQIRQPEEARRWAERILAKKPTLPRYLRRRERTWFRRAAELLKRIPPDASRTAQA